MPERFTIASPSPATSHIAHFAIGGEIRFGPFYYELLVDGFSFGQRIFGEPHLWSATLPLLAVQEWYTIDYAEGPITGLVLIDAQSRREATLARATKRFLVPEAFAGQLLVYREEHGGGADGPLEIDVSQITSWAPFS
jgi:hypothetical protein